MKPVICKHCKAVDRHPSFKCFKRPKKEKIASMPVVEKANDSEIKRSKPKTESLLSLSQPKLIGKAQEVFNTYIRLRDRIDCRRFRCISCGLLKSLVFMHAGHYYTVGGHSFLRFNENNVHGQCSDCNTHLDGNLIPYRIHLIDKIGIEEVEKLDAWCKFSQKWDRLQLIEIIEGYREKIKTLSF